MKTMIRLWMAGLMVCLASVSVKAQSAFQVLVYDKDGNATLKMVRSIVNYPNDTVILAEDFFAEDALHNVIASDDNCKLFAEAMKATRVDESVCMANGKMLYRDNSYSVGKDSVGWMNDVLVYRIAAEYENVAYPQYRYVGRTAFVETDDVFAKYGISTLAELDKKAHELYDPMYPGDSNIRDWTDPRNALNRFVAYHFLPFKGDYYKLTAVDGDIKFQAKTPSISRNFARRRVDIADWYESCMPNALIKFSYPNGSDSGLYINRRGVQSRPDERGVQVRGAKVLEHDDSHHAPVNGNYFYIDDIIAYDQTTQKVVLDERLRIDATTLSPDFISSGARGLEQPRGEGEGHYASMSGSPNAETNNAHAFGFKSGFCQNFKFDDTQTHLHVRPRYVDFWSYGGDELIAKGKFDITVDLPPLPNGDWEVRFGTCIGFESRGLLNFYLDGKLVAENVDMRPVGTIYGYLSDNTIGWTPMATVEDEEADWKTILGSLNWNLNELFTAQAKAMYAKQYRHDYNEAIQNGNYGDDANKAFDLLVKEKANELLKAYMEEEDAIWEKYEIDDESGDYSDEEPNEESNKELEQARIEHYKDAVRSYYKTMHDNGWMKGPGGYASGGYGWNGLHSSFRNQNNTMRYIIGKLHSENGERHTLRIEQAMPTRDAELDFDYLEFCPTTICDNPDVIEDVW